jgi:hypothetical protein
LSFYRVTVGLRALMNPPPHDQGAGPIREVDPAAKLPDCRPDSMWAGRSTGVPCAICGAVIGLDEMEYELEYARRAGGGVDTYHVHIPCFTARIWRVKDLNADSAIPRADKPDRPPEAS